MRTLFQFFSSMRLTVTLLALAMVLILVATLEQGQWGVYEIQHRYFEALLVLWTYPAQWPGAASLNWLVIPLPGGFLIGGLLVINLLCAHFRYFQPSWGKVGIALIHGGVLLLIISGFATAYFQQEYYMWLNVGGHSDYIESFHDVDLVLTDHTDPRSDLVVSIPVANLRAGATLRHPALPFTLRTVSYFPNSQFFLRSQNPGAPALPADQGVARNPDLDVASRPYDYANDTDNVASAIIAVDTPDGPRGAWLVSTMFTGAMIPPFLAKDLPQTFTVNGHTWEISLRPRREYLPYSIRLDKFIHEKYPGTDVPRRFESQVRLVNPARGEDRPVFIYMNHPLRYAGLTFYQASFSPNDEASMLQVVRNPGWILPYISVAVVGFGLALHFMLELLAHLRAERAATAPAPARRATPTRTPVPLPAEIHAP
jgi:hypothetical protein